MRIINLALLAVLTKFCLAYPASISSLQPRDQYCSNAPAIKAGTTFNRRAPAPDALIPRSSSNNVFWCVRNSQTYITLAMTSMLAQSQVWPVLRLALMSANRRTTSYDGLLPEGSFKAEAGPMVLIIRNANNHQLTWGVLSAAVWALVDYMVQKDEFGTMVFDIFDGGNKVGAGSISF